MTVPSVKKQPYTESWLNRNRWNVLDMITVVARGSVPVYLHSDFDMTFAKALKTYFAKQGKRITETALLLKAIAIAQQEHPESKTIILPFGIKTAFSQTVAGFTVERFIDSEPTVFFGTIEKPESKPLVQIADELRGYSQQAIRDVPPLLLEYNFAHLPWLLRRIILLIGLAVPTIRKKYKPATFGLTSLGKLGVSFLSGPCVGTSTFTIGAVEDRPIANNGNVEIRPIMTVILEADLRAMSTSSAARFLERIRCLMEGEIKVHLKDVPKSLERRKKSKPQLKSSRLTA